MLAQKRLVKELKLLQTNPPQFIRVRSGWGEAGGKGGLALRSHAAVHDVCARCVPPPPSLRQAMPLETNILEFRFVIEGPPDSVYAGVPLWIGVGLPARHPQLPCGSVCARPQADGTRACCASRQSIPSRSALPPLSSCFCLCA